MVADSEFLPKAALHGLERLRESSFQEFPQLGRRLELWDGIEFLEC